ncbi:hypothetical protein [Gluconobacter frateurii]|uniref:hypothetical protein n=1 Tax=Gluconobacter frateurii TaxID=38308 RepID=UPI00142E70AB|nr:hypothetical protein [Gluconobacter frateurii]
MSFCRRDWRPSVNVRSVEQEGQGTWCQPVGYPGDGYGSICMLSGNEYPPTPCASAMEHEGLPCLSTGLTLPHTMASRYGRSARRPASPRPAMAQRRPATFFPWASPIPRETTKFRAAVLRVAPACKQVRRPSSPGCRWPSRPRWSRPDTSQETGQ